MLAIVDHGVVTGDGESSQVGCSLPRKLEGERHALEEDRTYCGSGMTSDDDSDVGKRSTVSMVGMVVVLGDNVVLSGEIIEGGRGGREGGGSLVGRRNKK